MNTEMARQVDLLMREHKISPQTGFLAEDPLQKLPRNFANTNSPRNKYLHQLDSTASSLERLVEARRVEQAVAELPTPDPTWSFRDLEEDANRDVAHLLMLDCAILTHAFFKETLRHRSIGELKNDTNQKYLPRPLAILLWKLSKITGIAPSLSYALYALWNHKRKNPSQPLSLNTIDMIRSFTGTRDEKWFVAIHQIYELKSAPSIPPLLGAYLSSLLPWHRSSLQQMNRCLQEAAAPMEKGVDVLERMREHCDPKTYFNRIRLFYGFPRNTVFLGVRELKGEAQEIEGETGGQAPLMHFFLNVLDIDLDGIPYFKGLRAHMTRPHRKFIEKIKATTRIRQCVIKAREENNQQPLRRYNRLVWLILDFHAEHLTLVADYVGQYGETRGTGGPPLGSLYEIYNRIKSHLIAV